MKTVKKVSALVLTVMLLMSIMALPASAAVSNTVKSKMTSDSFPYLYSGVTDKAAVRALQKFLMTDSLNAGIKDIRSDGLDGGYGTHCITAVRDFQVRHGIPGPYGKGTGEVKNLTWGAIADVLTPSGSIMRNSGTDVYKYIVSGNRYYFYYFDLEGDPIWFVTV